MANVPPGFLPGFLPISAPGFLQGSAHRGRDAAPQRLHNESDVARRACFLDRGGVTVFMIHVKVQCDWWLY